MSIDDFTKKITNKARILRLLKKISKANLSLFIHIEGSNTISKGNAGGIVLKRFALEYEPDGFFINLISNKALEVLGKAKKIQIHFVAMSSKMVCYTEIKEIKNTSIIVKIPEFILHIERRQDARFTIPLNLASFVNIPTLKFENQYILRPTIDPYSKFQCYFNLADISTNGFCLASNYPMGFNILKKDSIIEDSALLLPQENPIMISFQIKWVKKITEHLKENNAFVKIQYRYGCLFTEKNPEIANKIKSYILKISENMPEKESDE